MGKKVIVEVIPRKVLVCALHRCQKCSPICSEVPKSCEWRILHPLETRGVAAEPRGRQTGKTTELVEIANVMAEAGYQVYYLSESQGMGENTKRRFRVNPTVLFMSWRQALSHLSGMAPGVILADEITPMEMAEVRRGISYGSRHLILAHYWTPRA